MDRVVVNVYSDENKNKAGTPKKPEPWEADIGPAIVIIIIILLCW